MGTQGLHRSRAKQFEAEPHSLHPRLSLRASVSGSKLPAHSHHLAFRVPARASCFGAPWTYVPLPHITWRIPLPFQTPWNGCFPLLSVLPSFNLCTCEPSPQHPGGFCSRLHLSLFQEWQEAPCLHAVD